MTLPGAKTAYRLFSAEGPVVDLLELASQPAPIAGGAVYCRHAFDENKRVIVRPQRVQALHELVWDGKVPTSSVAPPPSHPPQIVSPFPTIDEIRTFSRSQVSSLRSDYVRAVNPTPYKVSVSEELYTLLHSLWMHEAPVEEIS